MAHDVQTEPEDGRRARGQRTRAQLIGATLAIVERDGVPAVSHRSVAREAGVSPGVANYHFSTIDDLLVAALVSANEQFTAMMSAARDVDELADAFTAAAFEHRDRLIAVYELYLLAIRRPPLRPAARQWIDSIEAVAERLGARGADRRGLGALMDGLGLQALLTGERPDRREIAALLSRATGV